MKWKILRLFLPLLVAGFVLPMFLRGPDGRPIMDLSDWLPDRSTLQSVTDALDRVPSVEKSESLGLAEPEVIHRWQDEQGTWHFTNDPDQAPAHARPVEQSEADSGGR